MGSDAQHRRPDGVSEATVEALGKLSEALETVERARGRLYDLHQLVGHADLMLDEVVQRFRDAGHAKLAERIQTELVGRNVIAGRWTFQLVEEFDDGYYALFKELDRTARDDLAQGRRHLFEAEMKERRRTHGRSGHEATP
ncbi:hypothetical protein ACFO1B_47135 [Dactylosporangium siamense]|uniref:Uncharacterized protein n=1 Tax=Dactylosporangium siamense TaxID=685454 RepID=A0A919UHA0_9ACTN|nr:hypothetical protein [Dactylosporangium siamense]GIG50488.1 hypothetical protein Dsi01nite_085290 [Dactylosporangium siamense]